ncbi:hypothetical protein DPMN_047363 [Dreissena polymorpha]|uniref:Copper type II ascorbate-dependent monooxygenase N-terminal domain-containing protein n=1 Tax=Dreissena polymorpha TaxID=45954 RepID=A0A9D4D7X2_DREPO|nr:hypothetical protein DPMN_047363 [Dreissena polymorpha]
MLVEMGHCVGSFTFEPVISPGNEKTVHHIQNAQGECLGGTPPAFPSNCRNTFIAWAIGGEAFYFPEDVGFPVLEDPNVNEYYLMETHYNNPTQKTGVIDNFGAWITLTKQFRRPLCWKSGSPLTHIMSFSQAFRP